MEHPRVYGYFLLRFGSLLGLTGVCVAVCDGINRMAGEMDAAYSHLGSLSHSFFHLVVCLIKKIDQKNVRKKMAFLLGKYLIAASKVQYKKSF